MSCIASQSPPTEAQSHTHSTHSAHSTHTYAHTVARWRRRRRRRGGSALWAARALSHSVPPRALGPLEGRQEPRGHGADGHCTRTSRHTPTPLARTHRRCTCCHPATHVRSGALSAADASHVQPTHRACPDPRPSARVVSTTTTATANTSCSSSHSSNTATLVHTRAHIHSLADRTWPAPAVAQSMSGVWPWPCRQGGAWPHAPRHTGREAHLAWARVCVGRVPRPRHQAATRCRPASRPALCTVAGTDEGPA